MINPGRTRVSGRGTRRGAAVVEFAVIAPFLVAVTMGMIEVTRAVQVKDILTDAARSGCRLAALPATSNSAVTANVNTILTAAGISPSLATITIRVNGKVADVITATQGDQVSVQVAVPVDQVGWVTPVFFSRQSVESETLVMMRQG